MVRALSVTDLPYGVGGGTFVTPMIGEFFYRSCADLSTNNVIATLGHGGTGRIELSTQKAWEFFSRVFAGAGGTASFHSQYAVVGVEMLIDYQDDAAKVFRGGIILYAGPVRGHRFGKLGFRVPLASVRQMSPGSRYLKKVEYELPRAISRLEGKVPIKTVSTVRDPLVPPDSAYIEGAENYCVAPALSHSVFRRLLPGDVTFLDGSVGHTRLIKHPQGMRVASEMLEERYTRDLVTRPRAEAV